MILVVKNLFIVSFVFSVVFTASLFAEDKTLERGKQLYMRQCASCHGAKGQGAKDRYEESLVGDLRLAELAEIIEDTMPEQDPLACVADDARAVAAYIYDAFYSPEAQRRNQPARVELLRLSVPQYRQSVADLMGTFLGSAKPEGEPGLSAVYYNDRRFRNNEKTLERIDPQVDFHWNNANPESKTIGPGDYGVRWEGSLYVQRTGEYEVGITSANGYRLWFNDSDKAFIDGYVSSGSEPRRQSESIFLIGGRAYPLRIEFFKTDKEDAGFIQLEWKPPQQTWSVIPQRVLHSKRVSPSYIVETTFPPDDASLGYERGSAVSKLWDSATTYAAIEAANFVADYFSRTKQRSNDEYEKRIREFCPRFVELAFRRPLTSEQRDFFIDSQFVVGRDLEESLKRVVILTLKSPRFLYPGISEQHDDHLAAQRLALTLWDSLPDRELLQAAQQKRLHKPEQIAQQARRMLADPKAKEKLDRFFAAWLQFDRAEGLGVCLNTATR